MAKGRPILFSGEMVRAILSGRKTQTRRAVKPQPDDGPWPNSASHIDWHDLLADIGYFVACGHCPYGKVGDLLWVRETWGFSAKLPASTKDEMSWLAYPDLRGYRADGHDGGYCWRPSIHMPRWASRITLKVTDIRVERLQEVSEQDAVAEGLASWPSEKQPGVVHYGITVPDVWETDPRLTYKRLWDTINGKRGYSWASNPWVWVVKFERVTQ